MKIRRHRNRQDNFFSLILTKPTARKIILFFLFLEFFVVFALGIMLYANSVKTLRTQSVETHSQMLKQLSRSIDTISEEVEQFLILLQNETDLSRLPALYESGDMIGMIGITEKYNSNLLVNDHIHSLLVYYPRQSLLFSPSFGIIPLASFWDVEFVEKAIASTPLPNWEPRYIRFDPVKKEKSQVYTIVRTLFYTKEAPRAYIILNIESSYFETLAGILGSGTDTELQINNAAGIPLLYYASSDSEKGDYLETTLLSPDSYWTYRARISHSRLFRHVYWIRTVFFALLGVTLLLGTLLSILFSHSILKPIVTLAHTLSSDKIIDSSGTIYNQINDSIEHLLTENRELETLVEQQLPLLRTQFIESLLKGRLKDYPTVVQNLVYYGLTIPAEGYFQVLRIRLDSNRQDTTPLEKGEANPIRLTALNSLQHMFSSCCPAEVLERSPEEFVVLLGSENRLDSQRLGNICAEVQAFLLKLYNLSCRIGGGSERGTLLELYRSYREAGNSLKIIRFYEDRQILFFSEIASGAPRESAYPYARENLLLREIQSGDIPEAKERLRQFFHEVDSEEEKSRFVILQLFFAIRRTLHNLGIEFGCLEHQTDLNEAKLLGCGELYGMYLILDGLLDDLEQYVNRRREPAKLRIIEKLEAHIKENYADDMSLVRLSELVQLSVPYLSKLYKETRGSNLKDFIVGVRIKRATGLLKEENIPVNEIGRMVGYPNVHGFIKFFKKYTGQTPGRYRNAVLMKNLESPDTVPIEAY